MAFAYDYKLSIDKVVGNGTLPIKLLFTLVPYISGAPGVEIVDFTDFSVVVNDLVRDTNPITLEIPVKTSKEILPTTGITFAENDSFIVTVVGVDGKKSNKVLVDFNESFTSGMASSKYNFIAPSVGTSYNIKVESATLGSDYYPISTTDGGEGNLTPPPSKAVIVVTKAPDTSLDKPYLYHDAIFPGDKLEVEVTLNDSGDQPADDGPYELIMSEN